MSRDGCSVKNNATCKACRRGRLKKGETSQTFEREGLEVRIDGIPALLCIECGQTYYPPGISDKIANAADKLFELSEFKHAGEYSAAV